MTLKMKVDGRVQETEVAHLADASAVYSRYRDASGLGASALPDGKVYIGGRMVARVSYNGNVWRPEPWQPGAQPLLRVGGLA